MNLIFMMKSLYNQSRKNVSSAGGSSVSKDHHQMKANEKALRQNKDSQQKVVKKQVTNSTSTNVAVSPSKKASNVLKHKTGNKKKKTYPKQTKFVDEIIRKKRDTKYSDFQFQCSCSKSIFPIKRTNSGFEFQGFFVSGDTEAAVVEAADSVTRIVNKLDKFASDDNALNVLQTLHSVNSLTSRVNVRLDDRVVDNFTKIPDSFNGFLKSLLSFGDNSKKAIFYSLCLGSVGCLFYAIKKKDSKYASLALLSAIGAYFMKPEGSFDDILGKLFETIPQEEQSQDSEFQMDYDGVKDIAAGIIGILCLKEVKNVPKQNMISKILSYLDKHDRMTNSLTGIIKCFVNCIEFIVNFYQRQTGSDFVFSILHTHIEEIDAFIKDVDEIERDCDNKKLLFTLDNYQIICQLIHRGEELIKKVPREKAQTFLVLINNRLRVLHKLRGLFASSNFACGGIRQEPVGILLRGIPGVGKSLLFKYLYMELCKKTLPQNWKKMFVKDPYKFLYNRQVEHDYWDGFDEFKWVTIFDDFGQLRDIPGNNDNEYMNIIRAVNELPFFPHMAEIDKKSNTVFSSKFVVATTNMREFHVESIISPDALKRRFDFDIEVTVRPEFGNVVDGEVFFDQSALPIGHLGETIVTPQALMFRNNKTGMNMDFEEIVSMFVKCYELKRVRFEQSLHSMEDGLESQMDIGCALPELIVDPLEEEPFKEPWANTYQYVDYTDPNFIVVSSRRWISETAYEDLLNRYHNNMSKQNLEYKIRTYLNVVLQDCDFSIIPMPHPTLAIVSMFHMFGEDLGKMLFDINLDEFYHQVEEKMDGHTWEDYYPAFQIFHRTFGSRILYDKFKSWYEKGYNLFMDTFGGFISKLKGWVHSICHFIDSFGLAGWLLTGVMGKLAISGLFNWMRKPKEKVDEVQSIGTNGIPRTVTHQTFKKFNIVDAQMASVFDSNAFDVTNKIIRNNCYEFHIQKKDGSFRQSGFGTFVHGNLMLIPYHFVTTVMSQAEEIPEVLECKVKLRQYTPKEDDPGKEFIFTVRDWFNGVRYNDEMLERDVCLFAAPRNVVHQHPSIIKFFGREKEYESVRNWIFRLVLPHRGTNESYGGSAIPLSEPITVTKGNITGRIERGFMYKAATTVGDCGALFTVLNRNSSWGTIYGIHVAGKPSDGTGFSAAVTREMLEKYCSFFAKEDVVVDDLYDYEMEMQCAIMPARFTTLCSVEKGVSQGVRSTIIKSLLYDKYMQHKTIPAKLKKFMHDGKEYDPYEIALKKYCVGKQDIDSKCLHFSAISYWEYLRTRSKVQIEKRLLTFEEAVRGIENEPMFKSINRSTSMGYPYTVDPVYKGKGKTKLFGPGPEWDLTGELVDRLRNRVNEIIDAARQNRRLLHVFTDCLKDERRPIEKVLAGKTRLFNSGPGDLLVAYRIYFGSFQLWYTKNHTYNGSAIGLNPYSGDWNFLAKLMRTQCGDQALCGAGDYSCFDGSGKPEVYWEILDIINNWYDDGIENAQIRRILWLELVNSRHIKGNTIYEWFSSLPSGHALTALVNTMYNNLAFRYAWQKLTEVTLLSAYEFNNRVVLVAMGDDNIFAVSPEYSKIFNEKTISEAMISLGLIYTSEHKGEVSESLRTLAEIEFLKRKFRMCDILQQYVAPLQLDVCLEMPMWTKAQVYMRDAIVTDNMQNCIDELSLHGKAVFQEWVPKLEHCYNNYYDTKLPRTNFELCLEFVTNRICAY